jgi:peptidoglycan hydrolase-like protein with peptidoglycan-binding domain
MPRPATRTVRTAVAALLLTLFPTALVTASPANAANVATPGDFTGYGFDQCLAPSQKSMNAWLKSSPFLAVGIYISGDSRACRSQPNLTPTWVSTQLRKGWRLLPITLGPQASCSTRFPRYGNDETIKPKPGDSGKYRRARKQGSAEAASTVEAAQALGITKRSTLWYDIEAFDHTNRHCRESALAFLSAWTNRLHRLDYVSGVYSSVASGIKMLDDARVDRPGDFHLPDRIWLARWDQKANTSSSYIRSDGWLPGGRVKQYQGGHDETWGGVRINIDRNFLDLGKGSTAAAEKHCGDVRVDLANYKPVGPGTTATGRVKALQCLLKEHDVYDGKVNGNYNAATVAAARAWQESRGATPSDTWSRRNWMTLTAAGPGTILKYGSAGPDVRRVQRALNAASGQARLSVSGVFTSATDKALRAYQKKVGVTASGVTATSTWKKLRAGSR